MSLPQFTWHGPQVHPCSHKLQFVCRLLCRPHMLLRILMSAQTQNCQCNFCVSNAQFIKTNVVCAVNFACCSLMVNRVCLKHTALHPECFPLKGKCSTSFSGFAAIATDAAEFCFGSILHANISALLVPERMQLRPNRPNTPKALCYG